MLLLLLLVAVLVIVWHQWEEWVHVTGGGWAGAMGYCCWNYFPSPCLQVM